MREPMRRSIAFIAASAALVLAAAVSAWAGSDPFRARQWALDRIQADKAWSASRGAGVTIAVVDTGIDLTHPDLKGKIASKYTCVGGVCSSGGDDDNGHGTHVAGIAAAATGNGVGISGVAPAAKLMAVKVLDSDGSGACSDIELGIRWAADHGARVVNLSLGPGLFTAPTGFLCTNGLQQAAAYAWNAGSVVVIAAGNDSLVSLYSSDDLLVVGATGADDDLARYSNSGANIYAPGGDRGSAACKESTCILSTWKDDRYAIDEGTSMATPHVSGVAALLLARGYTNSQVLSRIRSTADNVNGILRVNAARAVGAGVTPSASKPPASGSGPGSTRRSSSSTGSQTVPRGTAGATGPTAPASPAATPSGTAAPAAAAPDQAANHPQALPPASERDSSGKPVLIVLAVLAASLVSLAGGRVLMRRFRGGG
jgi:serine protease